MEIKDIIYTAGEYPFRGTFRENKNDEAREMMGKRCHFYSVDTLKHFKCRVAWCDARLDGAIMVAVFSQPDAYGRRRWHYAVNDFTGFFLGDGLSDFPTRKQAEKALAADLEGLDARAVVKDALLRKLKNAADNVRSVGDAMRALS